MCRVEGGRRPFSADLLCCDFSNCLPPDRFRDSSSHFRIAEVVYLPLCTSAFYHHADPDRTQHRLPKRRTLSGMDGAFRF